VNQKKKCTLAVISREYSADEYVQKNAQESNAKQGEKEKKSEEISCRGEKKCRRFRKTLKFIMYIVL